MRQPRASSQEMPPAVQTGGAGGGPKGGAGGEGGVEGHGGRIGGGEGRGGDGGGNGGKGEGGGSMGQGGGGVGSGEGDGGGGDGGGGEGSGEGGGGIGGAGEAGGSGGRPGGEVGGGEGSAGGGGFGGGGGGGDGGGGGGGSRGMHAAPPSTAARYAAMLGKVMLLPTQLSVVFGIVSAGQVIVTGVGPLGSIGSPGLVRLRSPVAQKSVRHAVSCVLLPTPAYRAHAARAASIEMPERLQSSSGVLGVM